MIKRFDFCSFHGQGSMENDPEGIYCLHYDYEAMEARAIAAESLCEQRRRGAENIVNELALADKEIAELKAKLAEIEKQTYVGTVRIDNDCMWAELDSDCGLSAGDSLYASPVQQSPAVAVPSPVTEHDAADYLAYSNTTPKQAWALGWNQAVEQALSTPTPSAEKTINTVSNSMPPKNGNGIPKAVGEQKLSDSTLEILEQPDSAAPNEEKLYNNWTWSLEDSSNVFNDPSLAAKTAWMARAKFPPAKPQRITEQDAREIIEDYMQFRADWDDNRRATIKKWLGSDGVTLLTKLNEHKGDLS